MCERDESSALVYFNRLLVAAENSQCPKKSPEEAAKFGDFAKKPRCADRYWNIDTFDAKRVRFGIDSHIKRSVFALVWPNLG